MAYAYEETVEFRFHEDIVKDFTDEKIVQSVKEIIDIPFSIQELRAPTKEKLHSIFCALVCTLLNLSNEQVNQIPLHVMESISSPEMLLEDGAGHIQFIKVLSYFFAQVGIHDFTLDDLLHPKKKRTRKLLIAMVNYAQFCAQITDPAKEEAIWKMEVIRKDQENIRKKQKELPEKIALLKARRLERQKAVQELNLNVMKAEIEKLELVHREKVYQNSRTRAEVEELKNSLTVGRSTQLIHEGNTSVEIGKARTDTLIIKEKLVRKFEEVIPAALQLVKDADTEVLHCDELMNSIEKEKDVHVEMIKRSGNTEAKINVIKSKITNKLKQQQLFEKRRTQESKMLNDSEHMLQMKKTQIQDDVKRKQEFTMTNARR